MIALRPRQIRAAQKSIGRAGSWLAAWLIVLASSAFALRDPLTLEVAVLPALNLIDSSDHHRDHARVQSQTSKNTLHGSHGDHVGHDHRDCPLCGAPALASGAPDPVSARSSSAGIVARLTDRAALHVQCWNRGSVQSRAPPSSLTNA